jgi:hypothetical protein
VRYLFTSSVAGRGRSRLARPRAGGWRAAGGRVSMLSPRAVVRAVCGGVVRGCRAAGLPCLAVAHLARLGRRKVATRDRKMASGGSRCEYRV